MDRKTIAILVACFALLMLWPKLVSTIYPPKPLPPGMTNTVVAATLSANSNTATTTATAQPVATSGAPAAAVPPQPLFDTNAPEQTLSISNANARYVFTSRGGGLKLVELSRFPESFSTVRKKRTGAEDVATLNEGAPLPVGTLRDDGTTQGDGVFALTRTATGVRAEKVLPNGLTIVKNFDLGTNYLVTTTVRIENHGAQPVLLPARELVIGTATPLGPQDKGQFVSVMWYNGAKPNETASQAWFANTSLMGCVTGKREPRFIYRDGQSNVVWAAAHNQFFSLIAMPETPAENIIVRPVTLPRFTENETPERASLPAPQGYETAFAYPAVTLAAGQAVEQKVNLFAGPKEYRTLASIAARFDNNADLVMGYGGFFGGVAKVLLLAMNWIHDVFHFGYGLAIITITVLIKVIFWPLTAASTRSMKRMQALQPQMNAIKEKYKDDPLKMNKKTMEFMKEHKVSPLGGCLPMLIQIPVFMGFYRMIQSAIELRGASFLWIGDLAQPDTLFVIPGLGGFPFIGIPGVGLPFNLLPLLMGATQLWQARLTPPSPGMDPAQQKMMRYMPLMFIVILYNFSAGLALYWTVQNLLTIAQTKLTKTRPEVEIIHPAKRK
ncbi:MAG: membrane protein insertase YidC [Verrucomicrobia bacterium]|nr:membrane protein insertase YidC [Verrucomicrobiota bacterium]